MAAVIFFLFLISVFSAAKAQPRNSNITLNSSLSPTDDKPYWLSKSGQFAFGFYQTGDSFSVGIWFQNIQQKTVVWTANRDDPPLPADVTLRLSAAGRLMLRWNNGTETLIANAPQVASSASMLDSGNFVLLNSDSKVVWQTFDVPTDTILPGQQLKAGSSLISSISEINHSSGKFQLSMQRDGNLVQYPVEVVTVNTANWASNTDNAGDNVSLNLNSNGQLFLLNATGFNIHNITNGMSVSGNAIYRLTIDADGIFRLYSHSLNRSDNWSIEWASTYDKCAYKGLCGVNSYCALLDGDPECICPQGFDFIDQDRKDLGCSRKILFEDGCSRRNEKSFYVYELDGVSWEDSQYLTLSSITKEACKEECLRDCICEAALYANTECKKLKLPLRFGRRQSDAAVTTLIKDVSAAGGSTKTRSKGNDSELRLGIFISGIACLTVASFLLAFTGVLVYRYRLPRYKSVPNQGYDGFAEDAITLRSFKYEELHRATNNFRDEIGRGAFGTVFKGVMSNGKRTVAIKRLEKVVAEGEREFRNEMKAIGRTHHRNLVQLLGYCDEGTNKLLVYDYMSNGSLASFLFGSTTRTNWEGRVAIALNIARGLHYLHEECETPMIHCDIKPENILIDEKGCARISDFGLAKLLMPNQTRTYTGIRGTRGYVAPEWHRNLPITVKADVYSFGIMLLEIICCRRRLDMDVPEGETILVDWVYDCFQAGELEKLLQGEEVERNKPERMIKVGLWCTQDEPSLRPSMKKVVMMLEGTVDIPAPPCPTSYISGIPM